MQKLLKIHRDADQIDFEIIWSDALFVFDSNVLLDLYRLPKSARDDLIGIFKDDGFNSRIWIGFQVFLEFLNNRYSAISDQKRKFHDVKAKLQDAIEKYDDMATTLQKDLNKLQLETRHSVINPNKHINHKSIKEGISYINGFIEELEQLDKEQPDVSDHDQIKDIVVKLFKEKIGEGFDKNKLESIYKEGKKRYEDNTPPGYKDSDKEGSYMYEDTEYIRRYGDLILWKEIIEKAKTTKIKHVVLVTGDVKEDWWFKRRGQKLGPRKELLNEIYTEVPDLETFYMYDTSSFLRHARSSLGLEVQESSISELKELIEERMSNLNQEFTEKQYVDALKNVEITDIQMSILQEHCSSAGYIDSASNLAKKLGYGHYSKISNNYSRLSEQLGIAIGYQPSVSNSGSKIWWPVLYGEAGAGSPIPLRLHPNFVQALLKLGIVE